MRTSGGGGRVLRNIKPTILLTLLLTLTASAFEFTGKVVGVADGDTITVLYQGNKQYKVRLQHIDCPEVGQPFATKAKQALSAKVSGKTVTIKWDEMDRYKRVLGDVYLGKRWINVELVSEGLAWHYKFYSKDKTMAAAEVKARAAKLGIWSMPNPTPPRDFSARQGCGGGRGGPTQHSGLCQPHGCEVITGKIVGSFPSRRSRPRCSVCWANTQRAGCAVRRCSSLWLNRPRLT